PELVGVGLDALVRVLVIWIGRRWLVFVDVVVIARAMSRLLRLPLCGCTGLGMLRATAGGVAASCLGALTTRRRAQVCGRRGVLAPGIDQRHDPCVDGFLLVAGHDRPPTTRG